MFPLLPQNRMFREPPRYWGAAIAAAGAIGSALLGNAGASSANSRSSIDNWAMFWDQVNLANTSYQRAAKDLEKAGVNPMLLTGGLSGADTPKGSSFNYQNESAIPAQALANLGNAVSQAELNDAKAATEKSVQNANDAYAGESSAHEALMRAQENQLNVENKLQQDKVEYLDWLKKSDPQGYRSFIASEISAGSKTGQNPISGALGAGYDWYVRNKDKISKGINSLIGNTGKAVRDVGKGHYLPHRVNDSYFKNPYRGHK